MMKTLHLSASWTDTGEILPKIFLVIVTYVSSAVTFVNCQGPAYLYGTSVTFRCAVTEMGTVAYTWTDVSTTSSRIIYFIVSSDESDKHSDVDGIAKYDNFGIINNHPSSVDLTMDSLDFNDGGIYRCSVSRGESPPDELVIVEAVPIEVNVSCTRNQANCPRTVGNSDEFICTCNAVGAYPDTLELSWSNIEDDPTTNPPTSSTHDQRPGAYDYTGTATFIPTETKRIVTCTVGGYNGSWTFEGDDYTTAPPVCQLETSCNVNNTVVNLTCNCNGAIPSDGLSYSFFQNDVLIPSGGTKNSIEVSIEPDTDYVFGCRQCNGVNYGQESYSSLDVFCTDATTVTTPATSTGKEGNPTGTKGPPVGLIVGLSVGIPILIIILVLVIWFLKNRDGDSDKNKPEPPQPTAAPRTSQNVPDDQPMQEIQYADLDHGKQPPTNEIRKPQDEPTEYATVQSVIV